MRQAAMVLAMIALASCDQPPGGAEYPVTLYRNSSLDHTLRIHWATFDADESDRAYNANNCAMAARLLKSNSRAAAFMQEKEPDLSVGFWCEPGRYSEKGRVPSSFEAKFPTDTP